MSAGRLNGIEIARTRMRIAKAASIIHCVAIVTTVLLKLKLHTALLALKFGFTKVIL